MKAGRTLVGLTLACAAAAVAWAWVAEGRRREAEAERAAGSAQVAAAEVRAAAAHAERDLARAAEDRARLDAELARQEQAAAQEACRCADADAEEARRLRAEAERALGLLTRLMGVYDAELGDRPRERWSGVFLAGLEAALENGEVEDVFFFLERSRADVLLDQLRPADLAARASLPRPLQEAEKATREREARAMREFLEASAGGERERLRQARATLASAREERLLATLQTLRMMQALTGEGPAAMLSVSGLQGLLSPSQAYVAYALTPSDALALVVTCAAARVVPLGPIASVEDAAGALTLAPTDVATALPDLTTSVERLRALVLDPLALPAEVTTLIVSPEGALLSVPFCLLAPDADVTFVPSAAVYRVLRASVPVRGEGVLAVGDPDRRTTGRRPLPPLPSTREEAQRIGSVLLLGPDATERRFKEALSARPRWRAVHLGCHGDLEPDSPFHDALILGAEGEEDGFLSALDVAQLALPSDLVSLGSCETALGPVLQGRGIGALTRAFLYAGASRVLASQTKIDDEATTALVVKFYELWNPADPAAALSAAAALRAAQHHVRTLEFDAPPGPTTQPSGSPSPARVRRWEHPYYWAPWVLWGPP